MPHRNRLALALLALVLWTAITTWGIWRPADPVALVDKVSATVAWRVIGAGLFLAVLVRLAGWRDIGLTLPRVWPALRIFLLPSIYLLLFLAAVAVVGLPPAPVVAVLAVNMLAVGFSEELMFRGVLFAALRTRLGLWSSVWASSALFGCVHLLNAFTTGQPLAAAIQALTAFMTGVFFMATVLRSGSLVPCMLYHAAWNFLLAAAAVAAVPPGEVQPGAPDNPLAYLLPMLLILPNFLYGLWLLRRLPPEARDPVA